MEDEDLYTRITLRIPKDLHHKLTEEAKATSKSLNAEIIGRLTLTFDLPPLDGSSRAAQPAEQGFKDTIERLKLDLQSRDIQNQASQSAIALGELTVQQSNLRKLVEISRSRRVLLEDQYSDSSKMNDPTYRTYVSASLEILKEQLADRLHALDAVTRQIQVHEEALVNFESQLRELNQKIYQEQSRRI